MNMGTLSKLFVPLFFFLFCLGQPAVAEEVSNEFFKVTGETRCPVCGMFVGKYQQWLAQVRLTDGTSAAFDGVKDMAAYTFTPQNFGATKGVEVKNILVKDYYTLAWTDGRKAFYVLGSDVLGPMGHELVPFAARDGAENFYKDHHGTKILTFAEITPELIESLRKGHKMKAHSAAGQ
jgi:copper chaperone NosL